MWLPRIKKSKLKVCCRLVKRSHGSKTLPPTIINIGLKEKQSKGLIIDPADKKDLAEAVKSGTTLTDEADLSQGDLDALSH
jgi:hypothetical protein